METITLTKQATKENMLSLALILGYEEKLEKETTQEMLVSEANEKKLFIKEVLEDVTICIAVINTEITDNPETPTQYVAKKAQEHNDNWIQGLVLQDKKVELKAKQAEEEKILEEQVRASVGKTTIN